MPIIEHQGNKIQVKIQRQPDKSYFDEYVKTGSREPPNTQTYERYIIGEHDTIYEIEIILKAGYKFRDYERVKASLCIGDSKQTSRSIAFVSLERPANHVNGIKEYLKGYICCVDTVLDGEMVTGAKFSFHGLNAGESLSTETNIMSVSPESLGCFTIQLKEYRWEYTTKKPKEVYENQNEKYLKDLAASIAAPRQAKSHKVFGIQKVDAESFKKQGLEYGLG